MLHNIVRNYGVIQSVGRNYVENTKHVRKISLLNIAPTITKRKILSFSSSTSPPVADVTEGEKRIKVLLEKTFPHATNINVRDVSGGCGSMYTVGICTKEFKDIPMVKQHRLVHEALKHEIKDMHGIQIETTAP